MEEGHHSDASSKCDSSDSPCPKEEVEWLLRIVAFPEAHSSEELITAIAALLRLKGITMEILRDTCIGSYIRDLCDHSSEQVRSAAHIAYDNLEKMLFNWAESVNWSWHDVAKACTDAEKAKRNKAYNSLNLTPSPAWPPLPEKISSHYHIDGISNPLHGQETSRRGSRAVSHSPARNIQADFYGNQYFYTPSNHADVSRGKRARPSETYPGARKLHAHFPSHMH